MLLLLVVGTELPQQCRERMHEIRDPGVALDAVLTLIQQPSNERTNSGLTHGIVHFRFCYRKCNKRSAYLRPGCRFPKLHFFQFLPFSPASQVVTSIEGN